MPIRPALLPLLLVALATPGFAADDLHVDADASLSERILQPRDSGALSLAEALALAHTHNQGLNAQTLRVIAARAGVRTAEAGYWFRLDARYTGRETHTFPDPEPLPGEPDLSDSFSAEQWINQLEFILTQPIPLFGQQRLAVRAAELELQQQETELRRQENELRRAVVAAFHTALLTHVTVEVRQGEVERARTNLDLANSRFEAGAAPRFDVIRAEVDASNAEDAQLQAERQAALALLNFQRLLGDVGERADGSWHPSLEPATDAPPEFETAWDSSAVGAAQEVAARFRPELARLRLAIAQSSVGTSLQKRRPSLGLVGDLAYSDNDTGFVGENSHSIILQLDVPLWDGGADQAEVDQGQAEREALAHDLEAANQNIEVEILDAILALQEAEARLVTAGRTLAQATEALRIAQIGYDEGVFIFLDLLEAQNGLTAAQLNQSSAAAEREIAQAELVRALGFADAQEARAALDAVVSVPAEENAGKPEGAGGGEIDHAGDLPD